MARRSGFYVNIRGARGCAGRILCGKQQCVASVEYDGFAALVSAVLADGALQAQASVVRSSVAGARLLLKVGRAIAEARTALLLLAANAAGAAVSAASLIDKMRESWPAAARTWRSHVLLQRLRLWPQRRKAYAKAFRRRWDVGWRRLPARVDIPAEELLRRAPWGPKKKTIWGPQKWSLFRTQKWDLFSCICIRTRPKIGSRLGPPFWGHKIPAMRYGVSSRGRTGCWEWCCRIGRTS